MAKCVLIGYSGHAYVVIDAAEKAGKRVGAYTDKEEVDYNPFALEYLGFEGHKSFKGWDEGHEFILGIGDNKARERVFENIVQKQEIVCSIIHPAAHVASQVSIDIGCFIAAGAVVNSFAKIGSATIINTGAIVEHECLIGNSSHIAPGAVLAGNVKVGKRSFIGANAVVKQGVEIGNDVIVGAGSVVLKNVKSNTQVVGNPGRVR